MKIAFLLLLSSFTLSLYAEDGIQFSHGTYLFVDGDGTLFYPSMGSMSVDKFLQEADNALAEFDNSNS